MQTKINELKSNYTNQCAVLQTEAKQIEKDIERFCEENKDSFIEKRNKKLNFGVVAYRVTQKVVFNSVEGTIKAIKALNLDFVLRIKEEIDKDKIKTLDNHTLTKIGVSVLNSDKLTIEPDIVKLAAGIN